MMLLEECVTILTVGDLSSHETVADSLDKMRLYLRDESVAKTYANINFMNTLLGYVETPDSETLAISAMKCFTNILGRNLSAITLFCTEPVNGLYRVTKVFLLPRPASVIYYAVRMLHMLSNLSEVVRTKLAVGTFNSGLNNKVVNVELNLLEIVVTTMEYCLMASSTSTCGGSFPFPFGNDRCNLVVEASRLLYVFLSKGLYTSQSHSELLTRLHKLIINTFIHVPRRDVRVIVTQKHLLHLLMCMYPTSNSNLSEDNYLLTCFLDVNIDPKAYIGSLCGLLQLLLYDIDQEDLSEDSVVASLMPSLAVCTSIAANSPAGRYFLRQFIFRDFSVNLPDQDTGSLPLATSATNVEQPLDPPPMPAFCIEKSLMTLMTSIHTPIKRYVAELMFALCGNNEEEFVARCGMGNAIALLKTKAITGIF